MLLRCERAKHQSVLVYYGNASQIDISGGVLSVSVMSRSSTAGASVKCKGAGVRESRTC